MSYKPFYFFSDWIVIWFILYKLKTINFNPKIFILLGILENIVWCFMYSNELNKIKRDVIITTIIHFIIKLLMFYSLKDTVIVKNDIIFSIILYGIYMIWLKITHNQTVIDHYSIRMKEVKEMT